MGKHKLALDFGTTNSLFARWDDETASVKILRLPGLSSPGQATHPDVIPSLAYVHDGASEDITIGQAVRDRKLDQQRDNRLFRNFKRGLVAAPVLQSRLIDDRHWTDRDAGRAYIRGLIQALPFRQTDLEELVLTVPVTAFEQYLTWLSEAVSELAPEQVRIVDESTAAALGYAVTEPGAVVLVFDFGGGTLDLSLVQLPESREKTGGLLSWLRGNKAQDHTARVIAKAGRIIGGSDIDQWLLSEVLSQTGLSPDTLGNDYATLLTLCERVKIALSDVEATELAFTTAGGRYNLTFTRTDLETLLEKNGFYTALRRAVDKVMYLARQRTHAIYKEDIKYVLLVGGTALMPSVQTQLQAYFQGTTVQADKPFTAVAEGALQVAAGFGLEDYLAHGYGLRHLDPETNSHHYDEIIPMGTPYPLQKPVELLLGAAHPGQEQVEFIIGEINTEAISMVEVRYEAGQAMFVAQAGEQGTQIAPVNEAQAGLSLARLVPPGTPGPDRLKALFTIDEYRRLRLTVVDLQTKQHLIDDAVLASLR